MKKVYYAVKEGNLTGVFDSWEECQRAIKGYSSPQFKKFNNLEEANAFIDGVDIYFNKVQEDINEGFIVAYTDGSFNQKEKRYSYGVVIIDLNLEEHRINGYASNPKYVSSKNVSGEIFGVINALDWAISNEYSKIKIYHDFEGISKWISGEWKSNSKVSTMFVNLYKMKFSDLLTVKFEHVKGHSNNKYNEIADLLANNAIIKNEFTKVKGANWYTVTGITDGEISTIIDSINDNYGNNLLCETTYDPIAKRKCRKLVLNSNRLTINVYERGHKILVQGKITSLFQIVMSYIGELVDDKVMFMTYSDAYKINVDKFEIEKRFDALITNLPSDYSDSMRKLIMQSLINLTVHVEAYDYGQFTFPALRALEGHIKYIMMKEGHTVNKPKTIGEFFSKQEFSFIFKPEYTIADDIKRQKVEDAYKFFNQQRHTIFHFGDITGTVDDTRIISSYEEANEIIQKSLEFISDIY